MAMPGADEEDRPTFPDDPSVQHRHLSRLLHRLKHAVRAQDGACDLLALLIEDTQQHFASEEHMMERAEYPQFEEHCQRHAKLLGHLESLRSECKTRNIALTPAVADQLHNWFVDHELTSDADMLAFLGLAPER